MKSEAEIREAIELLEKMAGCIDTSRLERTALNAAASALRYTIGDVDVRSTQFAKMIETAKLPGQFTSIYPWSNS